MYVDIFACISSSLVALAMAELGPGVSSFLLGPYTFCFTLTLRALSGLSRYEVL